MFFGKTYPFQHSTTGNDKAALIEVRRQVDLFQEKISGLGRVKVQGVTLAIAVEPRRVYTTYHAAMVVLVDFEIAPREREDLVKEVEALYTDCQKPLSDMESGLENAEGYGDE